MKNNTHTNILSYIVYIYKYKIILSPNYPKTSLWLKWLKNVLAVISKCGRFFVIIKLYYIQKSDEVFGVQKQNVCYGYDEKWEEVCDESV